MKKLEEKLKNNLIKIISNDFDKVESSNVEMLKKREKLHLDQKYVRKDVFINNKLEIFIQEIASKSQSRKIIYFFIFLAMITLSTFASIFFVGFVAASVLSIVTLILLAILLEIYDHYFKYKISTDITDDYLLVKLAIEKNEKEKNKTLNKVNEIFNKENSCLKYTIINYNYLTFHKELNVKKMPVEKEILQELLSLMTEKEFKLLLIKDNYNVSYYSVIEKIKELNMLYNLSDQEKECLDKIYYKLEAKDPL